jgi:aldehyde:ferredoxin oxidoreductase
MQCPKCQFENPEGMKFCGGFGLALKGLQHDEAWLIFLDMVHNLMRFTTSSVSST